MPYDLHLADRVRSILARAGDFSEVKMFGGICFMVNGHMCCGVLKNDLVLKLTPDRAAAALGRPHTRPMDFTRQPMKSMIYVAPEGVDSDASLENWIADAIGVVRMRADESRGRTPSAARPTRKRS